MRPNALLVLGALFACGCHEGSGFPESLASGVVQYEGKPLEQGTITFIAKDGATPSAQGEISQGDYQVWVPHGSKRVEIHSSKWTGKSYEEFGIKEMIQFLPDRYNEKSTLTAEIGPENKVELNFDLLGGSQ